ncbi:Uncharacterised protein [Mycobacteroides abscessus subsp. abscessus]|nr:Uncharacterised protein [Mycobacteroides abscessus subsp. abscessus]
MAPAICKAFGEVKISPGHAAVSMPRPMNPACRGSCPEPPPDTMATWPGRNGESRIRYPCSRSHRRSAVAATSPRSASGMKLSVVFRKFRNGTIRQPYGSPAAKSYGDLLVILGVVGNARIRIA